MRIGCVHCVGSIVESGMNDKEFGVKSSLLSVPLMGRSELTSGPVTTNKPGSFHSKVVLTAVIGGILILVCAIIFLVFKISRYIRSRRERTRLMGMLDEKGQHRKGRNVWDMHEPEGVPA